MNNILDNIKRLHFIGIGGSGMCPMAEILISAGYQITGSDQNESDTLDRIKTYGIPVFLGHKAENIGNAELVVHTAAAKQDNVEIVAAKERGIPVLERSVVLGMLTKKFADSIAVSGTHGKTTTTSMITQVLIEAGKDPSAIIGGKLPLIGGNGRAGQSSYMVCEACEYVDTFLQLFPSVSVILNLEADHLDYFKNLENIISSFRKFATQTTNALVVNGDDKEAMQAVEGLDIKTTTFGLGENNDYIAKITNEDEKAFETFSVIHSGEKLCEITLSVPGIHNVLNALAAFATCHQLGVDVSSIVGSLSSFGGVHRRFEILGNFNGVTVADDFAHHPTELTAVLSSASKMNFNKVWAIFQPHTFSRTYLFLDDFAKALSIPEKLIVTDILAVREENIYGISTDDLTCKIPNSYHLSTFDEISDFVIKNASENDLILTLGGGDIYKCANLIVEKYKKL